MLVCTRTQEKGAVIPQDTDLDLPGSVQESSVEVWVGGGLLQSWRQGSFEGGRHYLHYLHHSLERSESEVAQLCPTLCNPVVCSPSGSSVHGILQARILEWVAISFSRGSS